MRWYHAPCGCLRPYKDFLLYGTGQCANLKALLSLCEALQSKDASKWEAAMQEEYDYLMANGMWELAPLP